MEQDTIDDHDELPGAADEFHESPYVHGVACGLQETFDISDIVYSMLVYGMEVPVTEDGDVVREDADDSAVAMLAIVPPVMPGGVPFPMVVPMLDDEEAFAVDTDREDLQDGDILAYYDDEAEQTRTGIYFAQDRSEMDLNDDEVVLITGNEDDMDSVTVRTGIETDGVEINGVGVEVDVPMANDDDEHEKDWWRIEEIEDHIDDQ